MVPSNDEAYSITRRQIRLPFVSLKGVIINMVGASVYRFQCELDVKIPYEHPIVSQHWASAGPILPASDQYRPGTGT